MSLINDKMVMKYLLSLEGLENLQKYLVLYYPFDNLSMLEKLEDETLIDSYKLRCKDCQLPTVNFKDKTVLPPISSRSFSKTTWVFYNFLIMNALSLNQVEKIACLSKEISSFQIDKIAESFVEERLEMSKIFNNTDSEIDIKQLLDLMCNSITSYYEAVNIIRKSVSDHRGCLV